MSNVETPISNDDVATICDIASTALDWAPYSDPLQTELTYQTIVSDLITAHQGGTPMRLVDMLRGTSDEIWHDLIGLRDYLNPQTGTIIGNFKLIFADMRAKRRRDEYAAGAELVRDHAVIGVSKGATRAEIERDIDRVLDGGGACSKSA